MPSSLTTCPSLCESASKWMSTPWLVPGFGFLAKVPFICPFAFWAFMSKPSLSRQPFLFSLVTNLSLRKPSRVNELDLNSSFAFFSKEYIYRYCHTTAFASHPRRTALVRWTTARSQSRPRSGCTSSFGHFWNRRARISFSLSSTETDLYIWRWCGSFDGTH